MNKKLLMALCGVVSSSALFAYVGEGAVGHYVMVRTGFGSLKSTDKITCNHEATQKKLDDLEKPEYNKHKNLSIAFGSMYDIWNFAGINIDFEIMGAYAKFKKDQPFEIDKNILKDAEVADVVVNNFINKLWIAAKNIRMIGAMVNLTYEQYLLDWASVCIGGGIGGGYTATKVTKIVDSSAHAVPMRVIPSSSQYLHAGVMMYNFMIFGRINWQAILFDFGYRHVATRQIGTSRMMAHDWDKQANLKSDQFFIGAGLQF